MAEARLKHYGWGREGEDATPDEKDFALSRISQRFGIGDFAEVAAPRLDDITLKPPRLKPPQSLAGVVTTAHYDRAAHTYGKSFPEYVRGLNARLRLGA